jgi:hypothetical protein
MARQANLTGLGKEGEFVSKLSFSLLGGGFGGFVLVDAEKERKVCRRRKRGRKEEEKDALDANSRIAAN